MGVWFALQDSIDETVDKDLRSRIHQMREYLARRSREGEQPIRELTEDAAFAPAGTRFRIAGVDGGWLFRSPGTEAWAGAPNAASLPKRGLSQTIYEHGQPVRVLSEAGPTGVIQIGMPLDEFSEMLTGFAWMALLASPVLLLLASAGGYWMSRRALAPVDVITRAAGEIEAKDLSQRLPTLGTGDELDQLSAKLNSMFGRLDDSFRRIAQFTADASHELRTPVAIIRTTAEVTLTRARSQDEYARALGQILSESERTTALIDDLMLLARSDASEENAPLEPVDLAELTRNACEDARLLAASKTLALTVTGGDSCSVRGDYEALRRLVLILIDNAIKYSHSGGNIQLHLGSQASGKRITALLEVRDHGIGIRPDDLPRIFERFYRVSEDRSRRVDGFGLGLSIAQSIVVRHAGEIQVESVEGAGSVFRVLLPAA